MYLNAFVQKAIHYFTRQSRVRHSVLLILIIDWLSSYSAYSRREIILLSWHGVIEHLIDISVLSKDAALTFISLHDATFLNPAFECFYFVRIFGHFRRRVFDSVVRLGP